MIICLSAVKRKMPEKDKTARILQRAKELANRQTAKPAERVVKWSKLA